MRSRIGCCRRGRSAKCSCEKLGELARQFGAPLFEPHVTIFIAPENSRAPLEVLREVGPVDIELTIHSIRFSEQFTKTLFVQFERNSAVQRLGDAIWKAERYAEPLPDRPASEFALCKIAVRNQAKTGGQHMAAISRSSFHLDLCDACASSHDESNRSRAVEITRAIKNKRRKHFTPGVSL